MYKIINGFIVRNDGSKFFKITDYAFVDFLGVVDREFSSLPELIDYLDYSYLRFKT